MGNIVEEELKRETVFKDESKLSIDYIPPRLPHREKELKALAGFFRSLVESPGKTSPKAIVRGTIGTGKTVLSKRFGTDLESFARKRGINLRYIHVNCREEGSFFNILKNILVRYYEPAYPHRGYSSQELLTTFIKILERNKAYVVLALDELEALIRKEGPDPLFSLTRVNENLPPNSQQRLSLICIFREPECREVFGLLDRSTLGTLGHNTLVLEKYSEAQLKDILDFRVREAFKEDAVMPESLDLIADLASDYGDARFAIELLWLAGKVADSEASKQVFPEHVRTAQMKTHPTLRLEELRLLSLHEKLFLMAVARTLRGSELAYATLGSVEEEYHAVCEEYGEAPRAHTQVWKYVKNLGVTGLLSTKLSGKGQRGKTTLLGLSVSSDRLERELAVMLEVKRRGARRR